MRVAVVGAGVVGVTTAYELAVDGHEVTVFERRPTVAEEGSFATAGVFGSGQAAFWPQPIAARPWWHFGRGPDGSGAQLNLQRLATFCQERLHELTRALTLSCEKTAGQLILLQGSEEKRSAEPIVDGLRAAGVRVEVLDAEAARRIEPGLSAAPLEAAVHLPQDGAINVRQFVQAMRHEAMRLGTTFRFDQIVRGVSSGTLQCESGPMSFDAIVICAGSEGAALLPHLPAAARTRRIHGVTLSAPVRHIDLHPEIGPSAAVLDLRHRVAMVRLGQRVRLAALDPADSTPEATDKSLQPLFRALDLWFPGTLVLRDAQRWKSTVAVTSDGLPLIGESGIPGVWLNLAHGMHGSALASGCARLLAERMAGLDTAVDLAPFSVARWR